MSGSRLIQGCAIDSFLDRNEKGCYADCGQQPGPNYVASRDVLRRIRPGPRVRMAARLYASGAVPTKRAACQAVGLSPTYLTVLDSHENEVTTRIQGEVEQAIADETIAFS